MADVLVKNLQETIVELKNEAKLISREITSANLEKKQAIEERNYAEISLKKIRDEYSLIESNKKNIIEEIKKLEDIFEQNKKSFLEKTKEYRNNFEKEKREQTKELDRLNHWIIHAKQEEQEYIQKLEFVNEKISVHKEKFENVLMLENEIKELQIKKDSFQKELEGMKKDNEKEVILFNEKIKILQDKFIEIKKQVEYAKNEETSIHNECEKKKGDLEIYYLRVKKAWDMVFPGKNMPMIS